MKKLWYLYFTVKSRSVYFRKRIYLSTHLIHKIAAVLIIYLIFFKTGILEGRMYFYP
jgi:hypothetical protein